MKPANDSVGAIFDERFSTSISPPPQKEDDWLFFLFDHIYIWHYLSKYQNVRPFCGESRLGSSSLNYHTPFIFATFSTILV